MIETLTKQINAKIMQAENGEMDPSIRIIIEKKDKVRRICFKPIRGNELFIMLNRCFKCLVNVYNTLQLLRGTFRSIRFPSLKNNFIISDIITLNLLWLYYCLSIEVSLVNFPKKFVTIFVFIGTLRERCRDQTIKGIDGKASIIIYAGHDAIIVDCYCITFSSVTKGSRTCLTACGKKEVIKIIIS